MENIHVTITILFSTLILPTYTLFSYCILGTVSSIEAALHLCQAMLTL